MIDPTNLPPGAAATMNPADLTADPALYETPLGSMLAFRAVMLVRQVTLVIGGVSSLFVLVKQGNWPAVIAWFSDHQGIATISVGAAIATGVWGQISTGKLKMSRHALRIALEHLGLNAKALDPTDKTEPTVAPAPAALVAAVVRANPAIASLAPPRPETETT